MCYDGFNGGTWRFYVIRGESRADENEWLAFLRNHIRSPATELDVSEGQCQRSLAVVVV